jgi:hypothetical protein
MISPQKFHQQARGPLVKINLVQYYRSQKSDFHSPYSDPDCELDNQGIEVRFTTGATDFSFLQSAQPNPAQGQTELPIQ